MKHDVSPDEKCIITMKLFNLKKKKNLNLNQIKPVDPITNLQGTQKTEEQVNYTGETINMI